MTNFEKGDVVYHVTNPVLLFVVTETRTDSYVNCESLDEKGNLLAKTFKNFTLKKQEEKELKL